MKTPGSAKSLPTRKWRIPNEPALHVAPFRNTLYYTTVTLSNSVACAVPTLYTNSGYSSITTSSISTDCSRTAVAWGGNQYGQRDLPSNLTNVIAGAGGWKHSLVLKADGTVSAFGTNNDSNSRRPL